MATITEQNPYEPPIACGVSVIPRPDKDGFRHYRVCFLPLWLRTTIATLLISAPFVVLVDGIQHSLAVYPVVFVVQGIVLGIAVYAITVGISDDGIRCPNFWGRNIFARWDDISEVRFVSVLPGLRYARIFTPTLRRPIWLPLFLWHRRVFWSTVKSFVKTDSPMHEAVMRMEKGTR